MASSSEELLGGDDIEGILAVINNGILGESNDLETEFAATVTKIRDINSESYFLCQNCIKTYKTKRGLNCHQSAEHGDYGLWIYLNSLWRLAKWSWQMMNALKVSWENFRHLLLIKSVSKTFTKVDK